MRLRIATEDIEPNHWVAWVLDLPGCTSAAPTEEAALALCPRQIAAYFDWIAAYDPGLSLRSIDFSTQVVERFRSFYSPDEPDYYVNAFFEDDARPLEYWDVAVHGKLLDWSHRELLRLVEPAHASASLADEEREQIGQILSHLAGAETWYFSHLGYDLPSPKLPDDPCDRLAAVRANSIARLTALVGDDRVIVHRGESWSARKILRRALWHERDHLEQIAALLEEWG